MNQPGTSDAIGAFSTLNTALQVGTYPPGTTLTFSQNSASANLNLPAGSTVLYAELTWGGGYSFGGQNVSGSRNNPITLTTPAGTSSVTPDPTFQRNLGTPGPNGTCSSGGNCFYVRTGERHGAVPGGRSRDLHRRRRRRHRSGRRRIPPMRRAGRSQSSTRSFSQPVRDLDLFVGSELSGATPPRRRAASAPRPGEALRSTRRQRDGRRRQQERRHDAVRRSNAAGNREPAEGPEQSADQLLRLAAQPRRRHARHQRHLRHAQRQRLHRDQHLGRPPGLGHHQRRRLCAAQERADAGVRPGHRRPATPT